MVPNTIVKDRENTELVENHHENVAGKNDSIVAVLNTHIEAEEAVKELQKAGFDMKKLSILGKDYHAEEHVVGYYNTGDRVKYWG